MSRESNELFIAQAADQVRSFHRHIDAPVANAPKLLRGNPAKTLAAMSLVSRLGKQLLQAADGDKDIVICRAAMVLEELAEWLQAHANSNVVGAADAIADRFYLLLGDAVATGLPLTDLFQEAHRSNMTKLMAVHTGVGKGVKGLGYQRPQIAKILARIGYLDRG